MTQAGPGLVAESILASRGCRDVGISAHQAEIFPCVSVHSYPARLTGPKTS